MPKKLPTNNDDHLYPLETIVAREKYYTNRVKEHIKEIEYEKQRLKELKKEILRRKKTKKRKVKK